MGAKCLRAYEDLGEESLPDLPDYAKRLVHETSNAGSSPRTLTQRGHEARLSPKSNQDAGGGKALRRRDVEEELIDPGRGDLESALEANELSPGTSRSLSSPGLNWFKAPQSSVFVTLHVYNIGTASIGRVLNRILKPLGTGAFHCGVEIYGCEWSYSDTTTGTGDGVFPSRPMCCEGHDYAESVLMGRTATSEDEVVRLIRLLKKEWPVQEYDTLKRNCCHFSNELCQRLGVGPIPSWVMNLAGAGAAIAATGDLTCCRQMATQVCCGEPTNNGTDSVEVVDVVEQMPVLPRTGFGGDSRQSLSA